MDTNHDYTNHPPSDVRSVRRRDRSRARRQSRARPAGPPVRAGVAFTAFDVDIPSAEAILEQDGPWWQLVDNDVARYSTPAERQAIREAKATLKDCYHEIKGVTAGVRPVCSAINDRLDDLMGSDVPPFVVAAWAHAGTLELEIRRRELLRAIEELERA